MLLNENSFKIEHPNNVHIKLKNHQLAMVKRCIDIEENSENEFGIMSDKPGTGKTYSILALIYHYKLLQNSEKKTNIIIVPQNIYTQWVMSIENFSSELTYNKFINYENIMSLYMNSKILYDTDIILTTSVYYHMIATTLCSLEIKIGRIFFDEIDSISNIISTKINADFIWFVSASFNVNYMGYYGKFIKDNDINNITCKCEDEFIDKNIFLEEPIKNYYIFSNVYIDNILGSVVSKKELKGLNAMDYRLNNKQFEKNKATNEKEVIDLILKNRKSIIEFNKYEIQEAEQRIKHYENCKENESVYSSEFDIKINQKLDIFDFYKKELISFVNKYQDFVSLKTFKDKFRKKGLQSLKISFDQIIEIYYYLSNMDNVFQNLYYNKKIPIELDSIIINSKKLIILMDNINKYLVTLKEEEIEIYTICQLLEDNSKDFGDLIEKINHFKDTLIADEQLEINKKQINTLQKNIDENQHKIDTIYNRLTENKCCPVCYVLFDNDEKNKIYITNDCCHNKICGECIDEWYIKLNKTSCIFCNTQNICLSNLICITNDEKNNDTTNNTSNELKEEYKPNEYNINRYNNSKTNFLKDFIEKIKDEDKKIIIFSDYSSVFHYIEDLCNTNDIKYIDLEKGNIQEIDKCVNEYKFGDAKILMSNSSLFGCGMNFENSTDILFVHKMNIDMETQVIGRAQRIGRKSILNIHYLENENESEFINYKHKNSEYNYYNNDDNEMNEELEKYYKNKQINSVLDNLEGIDLNTISGNNIEIETKNEINEGCTLINIQNDLPEIPNEPIDVNLQELIESLF